MPKLTQRLTDTIRPRSDQDIVVWDSNLPRFGLRVRPWGKKTFIIKFRTPAGHQRKLTIGSAELLNLQDAHRLSLA